MPVPTLFSWGYYGCGNHTPQFVKAVDAVEASRGFGPPLFIDIRIRRSVRATGFQGPAFERQVGSDRHRWMPHLGNRHIVTRTGPRIQIADPSAANELLDLALEAAREKRRVIYFCSCQWPKCDGKIHCHRATVTGLLLRAAARRGVTIEVAEWPGGKPKRVALEVTPVVFDAVRRGRWNIPLGRAFEAATHAGLPWCSVVTLRTKAGESLHRMVGPAVVRQVEWALPVLYQYEAPATARAAYEAKAQTLRREWGVGIRRTQDQEQE